MHTCDVGLSSVVKNYDRALDVILDEAADEDDDDDDGLESDDDQEAGLSTSTAAAQTLYGLIHARYILTQR